MNFADILETLPEACGTKLVLTDAAGAEIGSIANAPGSAGSFRVYAHLARQHGAITPEAAAEGLALFAEHAQDATAHPGRHPNIDRLIGLMLIGETLNVRVI